MPEPTADGDPPTVLEPSSSRATEQTVIAEELTGPSDQVHELATVLIKGVLVEIKGPRGSPTHLPATKCELTLESGGLLNDFW